MSDRSPIPPSRRQKASLVAAFLVAREEGTLAVFALILFVLMAMMGGIAVDLMRYEATRVTLQQTIDRATLAAASLEQTLPPEDVVRDYFEKAGLSDQLKEVNVEQGFNFRTVTAEAEAVSESYFMHMIGIDEMDAPGASIAEQRITNVEIALVLDVSGSMQNTPSRITNLKTAAKDFVDLVLAKDRDNKISIAIVPYNGQVNLGPSLFGRFSSSFQHGTANSFCLDLPTSTFNTTDLSRTTPFPQAPFADTFSSTSFVNGYVAPQGLTQNGNGHYTNMWCQPIAANYVRPFNNNATQLKEQIDALVAIGATSIDLGLKWGVTLLDPASRTLTSELIALNQVPAYFSGRPANYDDPETMKVIVLMTDGEHFAAEHFNDLYRTGQSNIWRSTGDGLYSVFHDRANTTADYWVPHRNNGAGEWRTAPWNSGSGTVRQTWPQVWANVRMTWVAWQLFARPLSNGNTANLTPLYNQWMNTFRNQTPTTTMDSRLDDMCEVAKQRGILIYGIAFEAPEQGKQVIEDCANQPSSTYFFDVANLEIRRAFRLIASNISQLRLTQ